MRGILVLLTFIVVTSSAHLRSAYQHPSLQNGFDRDFAYEVVPLAFAAYCNQADLESWTCIWCQDESKLHFVAYIDDEGTNTAGYVGIVNDTIVLSFRGTKFDSLDNWITDLKTAHTTPYPSVPGAAVHIGFFEAYTAVQSQVYSQLNVARKQCSHCRMALVTGHSLGAAIATLAVADANSPLRDLDIEVYTFGSPRVGNQVFATYYNGLDIPTWRMVHANDMIPHLPPTLIWFWHVAMEVWEVTPSNYTVCPAPPLGEDPACSDSVLGDSISDHLW
eukprot:TRINITY_DN12741_c0_g1_i1.p1 TRINITY_DN12741_c0_g1~~TRINITY_DN12741_c0_g1_i1.p1  ORF type:complete len:277 (-),score=21.56 TRINITY_DN12741_c0_g1_i1:91-921(-)